MEYIIVNITCPKEYQEILVAELDPLGFSSFWEQEDGIQAYFEHGTPDLQKLDTIVEKYNWIPGISYAIENLNDDKNWNEEWEKNFDPIVVEDKCLVRAVFHPSNPSYEHEIVINPKMSFGTGHHETTYLMLSQELEMNFAGKKVLDVGCGTGILAIMAAKLGAKSIVACDIDEWPVENSKENFALNNCSEIPIYLGTINSVAHPHLYDIVLANINRNVLLEEMHIYVSHLEQGGNLLLSGFYQEDVDMIQQTAEKLHLKLIENRTKNKWAMLCFKFEKP